MHGRFERPRNGRKSAPASRNSRSRQNPHNEQPSYGEYQDFYGLQPDQEYQGPYGRQSYDDDQNQDYGQMAPEQGYDPYNYEGGYDSAGNSPEKSGFGWGILSFFFPLVGLILWLVWRKNKPRAARASMIGGLTGFILFLVLALVLVIGGTMYYNHMLDKVNVVEMTKPVYTKVTELTEPEEETTVPETTEETTVATDPPTAKREDYVNFLIVGQAARGGEEERFADTMLVCTLNKFDNSLTVTSLLRDSFVQPPPFRGHTFGQIKLTTVYHLGSHYDNGKIAGSMELMNNTLFNNFGLEIDHNIEIDFDVFVKIVDCLGGVDVELTEAEAKYMNTIYKNLKLTDRQAEVGINHLDGTATLAYARMRKADGDGDSDIKRTARQRHLMENLMNKAKGMSLSDLQKLANEILPMITTNMSKEEMTDMLKTLLPKLPTMEFKMGGTCPINFSGSMVEIYHDGFKHSVLKFNVKETTKAMREITLGEIDGVPAGSGK